MDYSPGLKVLQWFTSEGREETPRRTHGGKREKKPLLEVRGGKKEAGNMVRKSLRRALEQGCAGWSCDGVMPKVGSGAPVLPVIWVPALGWLRGLGALAGTDSPMACCSGPCSNGLGWSRAGTPPGCGAGVGVLLWALPLCRAWGRAGLLFPCPELALHTWRMC